MKHPVFYSWGCLMKHPVFYSRACLLEDPVRLVSLLKHPVLSRQACLLEHPVIFSLVCLLEYPVLFRSAWTDSPEEREKRARGEIQEKEEEESVELIINRQR